MNAILTFKRNVAFGVAYCEHVELVRKVMLDIRKVSEKYKNPHEHIKTGQQKPEKSSNE